MNIELNINDGNLDLDDLLQQIPEDVLMDAVRKKNCFNPAYSVNEMSDMHVNHFKVLMCKVFGISEMSDDATLMRNFREHCKIGAERITVTLNTAG